MEAARFNLDALEPYETIVTGCASCTMMLKDYPSLFNGGEQTRARSLALASATSRRSWPRGQP
jgi:Fe-S oxidoreductase